MTKILWKDEPDEKDYAAAENYLALLMFPDVLVRFLRKAEMRTFKARDIIRASGLPVLGISNGQISKNLRKIDDREPLSPILLVRNNPLIIADGYHRVCAIVELDETEEIPCKIVSI